MPGCHGGYIHFEGDPITPPPLDASIECIEGRMDANRAKALPGGDASGGGRTGPLSQAPKMGIENGGAREQVGLV